MLILGIEYQKIVKKTNIVKKFLLDFANNRDYVKNYGYRLLRKCRDKREMQGTEGITMKNGKPAIKGTCPTCSTSMFRIGKA